MAEVGVVYQRVKVNVMGIKYLRPLDGVRGIAILLVMFGHFFMRFDSRHAVLHFILKKISILGQLGVALFFVLSGFLITRILLYAKAKPHYFKNFYARRVLRIFPLYYLFLVIFYFLQPIIFHQSFIPFHKQIFYWVYLQNFAITFGWDAVGPIHYWSLAVEEHFYLMWPFLVYVLDDKKLFWAIVSIGVFAIILRIIMTTHGYEVYYFTFTRMDALAIGSLLAIVEKNFLDVIKARHFFISFILFSIPSFALWFYFGGKSNLVLQNIKYTLFSIIFFTFLGLSLTLSQSHWLNRLLSNPVLVYTGKISYGLYVYHLFAYKLSETFLPIEQVLLKLVADFTIAYLIATVSYYFYEKNFLKLKKFFTYG